MHRSRYLGFVRIWRLCWPKSKKRYGMDIRSSLGSRLRSRLSLELLGIREWFATLDFLMLLLQELEESSSTRIVSQHSQTNR